MKLSEPVAIARTCVEKFCGSPTPGICFATELFAVVELHDGWKAERAMIGHRNANQLDAAEHWNFFAVTRHDSQCERTRFFIESVRTEQLCDALHVPTGPAAAEKGDHERVRAFVEQKMPTVVVAWLIA